MIAAGYVPGEHEQVPRAFREREPRRAAEAMREHIEEVRRQALRVAEALRGTPLVPAPLPPGSDSVNRQANRIFELLT